MQSEAVTLEQLFTEIVEQLDDEDPHKYHHHTRLHEKTFIKAQDNGLEVMALCGFKKPPDRDNPLKKPCCPKCRQLLRAQCLGEFYHPE